MVGMVGKGVGNGQDSGGDIGGRGVISPAVAFPVAQIFQGPRETAFCAGVERFWGLWWVSLQEQLCPSPDSGSHHLYSLL